MNLRSLNTEERTQLKQLLDQLLTKQSEIWDLERDVEQLFDTEIDPMSEYRNSRAVGLDPGEIADADVDDFLQWVEGEAR
jgi:hypothetical protein